MNMTCIVSVYCLTEGFPSERSLSDSALISGSFKFYYVKESLNFSTLQLYSIMGNSKLFNGFVSYMSGRSRVWTQAAYSSSSSLEIRIFSPSTSISLLNTQFGRAAEGGRGGKMDEWRRQRGRYT